LYTAGMALDVRRRDVRYIYIYIYILKSRRLRSTNNDEDGRGYLHANAMSNIDNALTAIEANCRSRDVRIP